MKHLGTKTIETRRLVLRKFTLSDAEPMYRNWASDPEVTRYLLWPAHESEEENKRYFERLELPPMRNRKNMNGVSN